MSKSGNPVSAFARLVIPAPVRWKMRQLQYWGGVLSAVSNAGGKRVCPICEFRGKFGTAGMPMRLGANCPRCRSGERQRLLYLAIERLKLLVGVRSLLHFAPENCLAETIKKHVSEYKTADVVPGKASIVLNIEKIDLPDRSFDATIAMHVLEHVDDLAALREIKRVLVPGGLFIAAVPIIEAWAQTYENPAISSKPDRNLHFGAEGHRRWYGRDFRDRLREAGFTVQEFMGDGEECVKYGLVRGDTIFICRSEQMAYSGSRIAVPPR